MKLMRTFVNKNVIGVNQLRFYFITPRDSGRADGAKLISYVFLHGFLYIDAYLGESTRLLDFLE